VLNYRRVWLTGGWLLVGLVIYLSLTPHPPEPLPFRNADKLEHALAYGSLALWFCQIYLSTRSRMTIAVLLVGLGIGLEFMQRWTGHRFFEIWDMAANGIGVLGGLLLAQTPLGRLFVWIEVMLRKNL
jgi:VanZ family protein